jgi:hypothetical protein
VAGRGPTPKDPRRRARTNTDPIAATVLPSCRGTQPTLPDLPEDRQWPPATVWWWTMWGRSPQAELMTDTDWSFLLDTALIHARFWDGDLSVAAELRLRVAKFGATLEDRARLRIQFADADQADAARTAPQAPSRQRRGVLHALPSPGTAGA